jgi:hypothetical protein
MFPATFTESCREEGGVFIPIHSGREKAQTPMVHTNQAPQNGTNISRRFLKNI